MTTTTRVADPLADSEARRDALNRFVRFSAAVFSFMALRGAFAEAARGGIWYCCFLASGTWCDGTPPNFVCPDGYHREHWYCCHNGQVFGCGECTKGDTCYDGPFACSSGWAMGWTC
jgi:hypothetical protein